MKHPFLPKINLNWIKSRSELPRPYLEGSFINKQGLPRLETFFSV